MFLNAATTLYYFCKFTVQKLHKCIYKSNNLFKFIYVFSFFFVYSILNTKITKIQKKYINVLINQTINLCLFKFLVLILFTES